MSIGSLWTQVPVPRIFMIVYVIDRIRTVSRIEVWPMYGLHSRMALILSVATFAGVHVARVADSHLAQWRLANAFAGDAAASDAVESRYSLVVRANGDDLVEDETTIGVLKLAAGPLRFDFALYDECQLRSPAAKETDEEFSELDGSSRSITVFVDPTEDGLAEECPKSILDPKPFHIMNPAWVLLPLCDTPTTAG